MEKKQYNKFLYLEDVAKQYDSKIVLDDIDLSVKEGEFCTLIGPSGCGKSTLLRLILGQEMPTNGTINFMDHPIGFSNEQRGIVYKKYSLFPHLSVLDNITLGKRLQLGFLKSSEKKKAIKEEALEILKRIGLEKHPHKYPHELSGGMQKRVAIAQALIMKPKILLMDEPFGALDPGTRENMQLFLLELWEQSKMTIFFVTHDLEEAIFLGTRVLVLSQYYSDGRGSSASRGARIVADYQIKDKVPSKKYKETADFGKLISTIRYEGFNPDHLQHVLDFNLKHPDSFQSLSSDVKERK